MGKLSSLDTNDRAVVVSIEAEGELKQRFFSFGLRKGSEIQVKAISIAKKTIEIEVDRTLLALRMEEANAIEVSLI